MESVKTSIMRKSNSTLTVDSNNNCSCCEDGRNDTCFSKHLNNQELQAFNGIVKHAKKLHRGEFLYRAGDEFKSIYTVRSGSLKTLILDEEGHEQILGFSIQGDVIALDGATQNVYPTSAQALETTYVCDIPFARYMELAVEIPSLYQQLLTQMSHQIRYEEEHTLMLGTKSAEQRLATMLINFSDRYASRGFSRFAFNIHMSRRDIGNYLSTAMETVSRLFTRLQSYGFIEVHGKSVEIKDLEGLKKFAS